ncbi:VirB4 family type IV secretion/conjugal transfer ATPase [Methylomonas sp. MO1]|uniref:VirB4 family type IV secretion/conjugal transfer ATPase n=1 Tax=Methylomonas sp. MO1 TaxID=3073619 RepID=UPI0028A57FEC|nr:VirB4 family type IV secretion/conjugal transfer ATPase [Methylomonas sp. MO1]MDT4292368.1 VirB4 family type IV secretion/conjugal transfer ATPase [Methylomonas sp. MO1]
MSALPDLKHYKALLREEAAALHIPYTIHVNEHVVKTYNGYVMAFKLAGIGFENADDEQLNNWHERLNVFYRNIAKPNISIWQTIVRHREDVYPDGQFKPGFADDLNKKYRHRIAQETLMVNDIYLAIVYRPQPGQIGKTAISFLNRINKTTKHQEQEEALEEMTKLQQHVMAALNRYDPESLGIYRNGSNYYSALLEYFGLLINGESQRIALPRSPLNEVLATSRLSFGTEAMEYRTATETRVAAILGIKEYPTPTVVGMFNGLLKAPFSFVLTQSYTFITKAAAQALLVNQFNRMVNIGDLARTQAEDLETAIDQISGNEIVMGDHHFSLLVQGEPFEGVKEAESQPRLRELNTNVAWAKTVLGDTGMTVAREDLALEAAFWAQLPGNFAHRTRLSPITSRNLAAMAPYHNYPVGRATGNHWGEAMAVLISNAKSNYYFSLHASDPKDASGGNKKDVGHTSIYGQVGSGKTVLIGFLICMNQKLNTTQVIFDKDYGLEILIRALGGCYLPIQNKKPTGFNPLQLEPTPNNVEFMSQWLHRLAYHPNKVLSVRESKNLKQALEGVLALEHQYRRLSRLVEFLDVRDPEGLHARLSKWCESTAGEYAWVFDNEIDITLQLMSQNAIIGFDVTDFIDNQTTCAPITMYLFHLTKELMDGRRLICWMDEFWRLLDDPTFQEFSKDGLKTARKKNGAFAFATQSVGDSLESPIARDLVEQTATKIIFPNDTARPEEYIDVLGLSEREYLLIKQELEPGSRQFLVKQGNSSVVCELDLKGFEFELDVISGRSHNVEIVRELIAEVGDNPADWLPLYQKNEHRRKTEKAKTQPRHEPQTTGVTHEID